MISTVKILSQLAKNVKKKKWFKILENSPQYLYLASGVKNGEGFWIVGVKNCDENIFEDKNLLDCHRKELIELNQQKIFF